MRILVCTSELPYPPLTGTRLVLDQMVRRLAAGHEVTVVGYRWPEQRSVALPGNVTVYELPSPRRGRGQRAAGWLSPRRTPIQALGLAAGLAPTLSKLLAAESFDVAHVTGPALAQVVQSLGRLPKVMVALDAWHLNARAQTLAAAGPMRVLRQLEEQRIIRFQRRSFPDYDAVVTVTDEDAAELVRIGATRKPVVIPNGVDTDHFQPPPDDMVRDPNLLVFVGTMRWSPNIHAAEFLAREVLPRVRERYPQVRVAIVGRSASPQVRSRLEAFPGVAVIGEVEHVGDWLTRAGVFCCPMLDGSGIKNKVLEALACGTPTVATSLATRGMSVSPGRELCIADDAGTFADAVTGLLSDRNAARRMGERGRRYVAEQHSWEAATLKLLETYECAAALTPHA